jgi:hypothetical protein
LSFRGMYHGVVCAESVGFRPLEFRHLRSGGIEFIPCPLGYTAPVER